jgi:hypothetical protein
MKKKTNDRWGIVRYAGSTTDPTAFDGWYESKALAQEVYDIWRSEYPQRTVSPVKQERVEWPRAAPEAHDHLARSAARSVSRL